MTDQDIETLCSAFYCLRFEEIHSLDNALFPWLPQVRGLTLLKAVEQIRGALKCIEDHHQRLQAVASLYCWLVPRGIFDKWTLYRLHRNLAELEASAVMVKLAQAMESPGCGRGGGFLDTGSAMYFCVMTMEEPGEPIEHKLVCFCIWHQLPFLAVHASGGLLQRVNLSGALRVVLGDPEMLKCGTFDDLRSARLALFQRRNRRPH